MPNKKFWPLTICQRGNFSSNVIAFVFKFAQCNRLTEFFSKILSQIFGRIVLNLIHGILQKIANMILIRPILWFMTLYFATLLLPKRNKSCVQLIRGLLLAHVMPNNNAM